MTTPNDECSDAIDEIVLGRHRLIARLARGGMGDVFLAVTQGPGGFNRLCVVKELRAGGDDRARATMFFDEGRLGARLNHPNVVQTTEVGSVGDRHFIVMEYLDGRSLHQILKNIDRKGPTALAFQLRVLVDTLAGLHYAHELTDFDGTPLHVVHRDVSPHNVIVTYDGVTKVVDFGIAKSIESEETLGGIVKGKFAYMSPEQASGRPVDRRTDVYLAGIMLWEAIAARRMWGTSIDVSVVLRVAVDGAPRIRDAAPDAPAELARICDKALAKLPDARYATAQELQRDLEAYLATAAGSMSTMDIGAFVAREFAVERARLRGLVEAAMRRSPSRGRLCSLSGAFRASGETSSSSLERERSSTSPPPGSRRGSPLGGLARSAHPSLQETVVAVRRRSPRALLLAAATLLVVIASSAALFLRAGRVAAPRMASAAAPSAVAPSAGASVVSDPGESADALSLTDEIEIRAAIPRAIRAPRSSASSAPARLAAPRPREPEVVAPPPPIEPAVAARPIAPPAPSPPPAPVATAPATLRFGAEMERPRLVSGRDPVFTPEAIAAGVEGTMVAKCTIAVSGALEGCRLLKTLPLMEKSVLDALATRRYTPVTYEGRARPVEYVIHVKLVLPGRASAAAAAPVDSEKVR